MLDDLLLGRLAFGLFTDLKTNALSPFAAARTRLSGYWQVMFQMRTWLVGRDLATAMPFSAFDRDLCGGFVRFHFRGFVQVKQRVLGSVESFTTRTVLAFKC